MNYCLQLFTLYLLLQLQIFVFFYRCFCFKDTSSTGISEKEVSVEKNFIIFKTKIKLLNLTLLGGTLFKTQANEF